MPFVVPDMTTVVNQLLATPHPRGLPDGATLALMASQRAHALEILRGQVDPYLEQPLPASGQPGDGSTAYGSYSIRALWSLMAYVYDGTDIYRQDAKRRVLNLASWAADGPTRRDDQESFYIAWVVTLGYDWLEPDLSASERQQVLSMLNTRIGDLYNWIIGVHGWPPGDPDAGIPPPLWQSPRDSHRQLWAELIAAMSTLLAGDLPAASTWVRELLPFTLNLTMPWSGEEGGHANGTAYSMWDVGGSLGTLPRKASRARSTQSRPSASNSPRSCSAFSTTAMRIGRGPSAFPLMSQSAMSTALIAEIRWPRRPSRGKTWPRAIAKWARLPLYMTSQRREMSRGSWPTRTGASSFSTIAQRPALLPALPTAALPSPQPTMPASVSILTSDIWSQVIVSANVRLHLWFTSRFYPGELQWVRARTHRWVTAADWVFSLALVVAGLLVGDERAALATLLISFGIGTAVVFLVVEPVTERAAFGRGE